MTPEESEQRRRILWGYVQRARDNIRRDREHALALQERERALRASTITIGPAVASTNGIFVIDSIASASTNVIYPPFYGGTVDPETGRLYDAREPNRKRGVPSPREKSRARARRKAARHARKKNR